MVELGKRLARRNTSTRNAGALNRYKQGVCKTSERNCSAERTQKRQVKKPSHRPPKGQSATQLFYLSSLRSPRGAASFRAFAHSFLVSVQRTSFPRAGIKPTTRSKLDHCIRCSGFDHYPSSPGAPFKVQLDQCNLQTKS